MSHELILLPKAARSRIAEVIRGDGIRVDECDDKGIRRHRRAGDCLYLCRRDQAAVELLVTAEAEVPKQMADHSGVIFFPHGGMFRQFRSRRIDAQLQQSIGAALYRLKSEFSREDT